MKSYSKILKIVKLLEKCEVSLIKNFKCEIIKTIVKNEKTCKCFLQGFKVS